MSVSCVRPLELGPDLGQARVDLLCGPGPFDQDGRVLGDHHAARRAEGLGLDVLERQTGVLGDHLARR